LGSRRVVLGDCEKPRIDGGYAILTPEKMPPTR
jgi:hypothetical protein